MAGVGPIGGSFHIAQAYRAQMPGAAQRGHAGGGAPAAPDRARSIVAGAVSGKVSFSDAEPSRESAALSMYRHPADKNAAATAVSAGRMIDVMA